MTAVWSRRNVTQLPVPHHDPAGVRDSARAILRRAEFQPAKRSWWSAAVHSVLQELGKLLGRLLGLGGGSGATAWVAVAVLTVIVGLIGVLAVRFWVRLPADPSRPVVVTAANVSDVAMLPDLLHGEETRVWGDGAYQGQTEVIRECAPRARDFTQRRCRYKGQIVDEVAWAKNRTKSKVRARVEHVFQVMKLKFGFVKVRYRGLKKNAHRLFVTCALVNLFVSRRKLLTVA